MRSFPDIVQEKPISRYWLNPRENLVLTSDTNNVGDADVPTRCVWDLLTGKKLYTLLPGEKMSFPTWSKDGKLLYAYCIDGKRLQAWDARSGAEVWSLVPKEPLRETGFRLGNHPELGPLALLRYDETEALQVFSATTGQAVTEEVAHPDAPAVQHGFSPGGKYFWSWLSNGVLVVYETTTGRVRLETRPKTWSPQVYFTPDGSTVLAVPQNGKSVGWWRLEVGEPASGGETSGASEPGRGGWMEFPTRVYARLLPSGRKVAIFDSDGQQQRLHIDVYDLATRGKTASFDLASETADGAPGRYVAWRYVTQEAPWEHVLTFPLVAVIERARQNTVVIWDLESGQELRRIPSPWFLSGVEFTPDARRIATVSVGHDVMLWDIFKGTPLLPEPIEYDAPVSLAFSPDGGLLMSSVWPPDTVQFLDSRTGKQLFEPLPGFFSGTPTFSSNGDRVALYQSVRTTSAGVTKQTEGCFRIVDIVQRPIIFEGLVGSGGGISALARFTADGSRVVAVSRERPADPTQAMVFDARFRRLERAVALPANVFCTSLEVSPDSRLAVLGCTDQIIRVLSLQSGQILHELVVDGPPRALTISDDGRRVAAGTSRGKVRTFDLATGAPLGDTQDHGEKRIRDLSLSPDGTRLLSASLDYTFRFTDAVTGEAALDPVVLTNVGVRGVFLGGGTHAALVTFHESTPILDLDSGKIERELPSRVPILASALSPDGNTLALGGGTNFDYPDGEVLLYDWRTGRRLTRPLSHKGQVGELTFSHDGTLLVSGTNGPVHGGVQVWDVQSGRALTDPIPGGGSVQVVGFSADDTEVLAAWSDGQVRIVDLPPRVTPRPEWLETLVKAVGGMRLPADKQVSEDIPDEERRRMLEQVVGAIHSGADDSMEADTYVGWARWFLADPFERTISPGASVRLADHLSDLRSSGRFDQLLDALSISPSDGVTHARIGLALYDSVPGEDDSDEQLRRHWRDTALWYLDRATELEPDNPQVWLLRAELLDKLGRRDEAREALARSESFEKTASANVAFRRATTLARDGKWAEADTAFDEAIRLLVRKADDGGGSESGVPLLGVLEQLEPSPAALDFQDYSLPEPIPGTFEDFDSVHAGALPEGWTTAEDALEPGLARTQHRSQRNIRTAVIPDWFVMEMDRHPSWDILNRGNAGRLRGTVPATLMSGRFLTTVPREDGCNRPARSVETRDFDLSGRRNVHVAFQSSWYQAPNSLAGVEYSTDAGKTWKPVVYLIDAREIVYDTSGGVDAVATLTKERRAVPWYIDSQGRLRGANYADYIHAEIGPELAACIDGRRAGHLTDSRRIEVFRLPVADGQKTVRLRFVRISAPSAGRLWGVDHLGLYEIPDGVASTPLEKVDSTSDPTVLAGLGLDSLLDRVRSSAVLSALSPSDLLGLSVAEPEFGSAQWIWRARESTRSEVVAFRRIFRVELPVRTAHILAACDDQMELYINERLVLSTADPFRALARSITTLLRPGDNVVAVRGENSSGVDAGLLLRLEVQYEDGRRLQVVSDGAWLASRRLDEGWEGPGFDASGWVQAQVLGPYGISPWKRRYDSSNAAEDSRAAGALLLRRAARLAPDDPWVLLASAHVKGRVGLLEEAFEDLRRSLEIRALGPHSVRVQAALWVLRGDELKAEGNTDGAAVAYELADVMHRALSTQPDTDLLPRLASVGLATDTRLLLPRGSTWKYLDRGDFPEEGWIAPDYDDGSWQSGPARLGFGEGGGVEKTRIESGDPQARRPSVHFRTSFEISDPGTVSQLKLRLVRDDGAVLYLNGQEIARDNMPRGPVLPTTLAVTFAGGAAETTFQEIEVLSPPLRRGRNVLAVSVHQTNATSSDLGFDLEVEAVSGLSNRVGDFSALETAEESLGIDRFFRGVLWLDRARRLRSAGQLKRAGKALEIARELSSDSSGVLFETSLLALARGNEEEARRALLGSLEAAVRIKQGPSLAPELFLPDLLRTTVEPLWDIDSSSLVHIAQTLQSESTAGWEIRARWVLQRAEELASTYEERLAVADAWVDLEPSAALEIVEAALAGPAPETPSAGDVRRRRDALRLQARILESLGRTEERSDVLKELGTPLPRPEGLDPRLLDLSGHYTAGLYGGWYNRSRDYRLRWLPETWIPRDGVQFDLRGVVQLNSGIMEGDNLPPSESGRDVNQILEQSFPDNANGIRVDRQVKALHFLGGALYARQPVGETLARVVVHYADGSSAEVPFLFGPDLTDWAGLQKELDLERVAWRIRDTGQVRYLLRKTWENPSPEKQVSHLDFISTKKNGAPFLVAVTAE
jgi:WD40 repeat protein/tetratricopeptide (TPR) repeat protein